MKPNCIRGLIVFHVPMEFHKIKATTIIPNNEINIKICENNVLYQNFRGHKGSIG